MTARSGFCVTCKYLIPMDQYPILWIVINIRLRQEKVHKPCSALSFKRTQYLASFEVR
jgi:hypothetical protein